MTLILHLPPAGVEMRREFALPVGSGESDVFSQVPLDTGGLDIGLAAESGVVGRDEGAYGQSVADDVDFQLSRRGTAGTGDAGLLFDVCANGLQTESQGHSE